MALDAGVMSVTIEFAQGLKDMDWFGRQDPYCIVTCGTQTYRTRTAIDGGKSPVWNETFRFNVINDNDITLTLKDEDTLTRDDLIGTCRVQLARARERGQDKLMVPVLTKKNKQHGFVSVSLHFSPNSLMRPQHQQAAPVPYMQPAPAYAQPAPYPYPYPYAQAPSFAPPAAPAPYTYTPSFGPPPPAYPAAQGYAPAQAYAPGQPGYAAPSYGYPYPRVAASH